MAKCGSRTAGLSQTCAKESNAEPVPPASLDSLHAAAGQGWCVCTSLQKAPTPQSPHTRSQNPGTRKDPPGSDLWPGGSCCIEMIPTRSNVQTRAAPKRRGVGLTRAERSGSGTAAGLIRAKRRGSHTVAAKRCGSRHCRPLWTLFTLRRGWVGANTHPCKKHQRPNRRTHACKTRAHGKT